jgi:hypothetical protein
VIPGEDGQFIKSGYEVPPSSDVTSKEDAKSEHRDRVHEATGSCPEDKVSGHLCCDVDARQSSVAN